VAAGILPALAGGVLPPGWKPDNTAAKMAAAKMPPIPSSSFVAPRGATILNVERSEFRALETSCPPIAFFPLPNGPPRR